MCLYEYIKLIVCFLCVTFFFNTHVFASKLQQDLATKDEVEVNNNLKTIENQIIQDKDYARDLDKKVNTLRDSEQELQKFFMDTAENVQDLEGELRQIENRLEQLKDEEYLRLGALKGYRLELQNVLIGLQRLSVYPVQAVTLEGGKVHDLVRGAMLLRYMVSDFEDKVRVIESEMSMLEGVRGTIKQEISDLQEKKDMLHSRKSLLLNLEELVAGKRKLVEQESHKYAQRVKELAKQANNLKDIITQLKKLKLMQTLPRPMPKVDLDQKVIGGGLSVRSFQLPVVGEVLSKFGDKLQNGTLSDGLRMRTRAEAIIMVPADGIVAYADIFRNYGLVLIIEHTGGYHTLLTGMGRLNAVVGQWVVQGEPIGVMGNDENNIKLYIELRLEGKPIDPLTFVKVSTKR